MRPQSSWLLRLAPRWYYGWVLVVMLGITQTISWGILFYAFSVLLVPMEAELGWSRAGLSGTFSVALLAQALAAPLVGRWLDLHGPRLLMTAGSCAGVLLVLAWSRVETLGQFYLVMAAIGAVTAATLYEPAFAVVTQWFSRHRGRAVTAVTLMAGLASTVFQPLAGWLVESQGWRDALVTLAVVLAVGTIPAHWLMLRRRPEDLGLHVDGEPPSAGITPSPARPLGMPLRDALRGRAFVWLAVAFSAAALAVVGTTVHLVTYLAEREGDARVAATAAGAVGIFQVLGRIVLVWVGERLPLHWSGAVVILLYPAGVLAALLVPGLVGVALFVMLFGGVRGGVTIIRPAFVAALYGRQHYGSIAGALASVVALTQAAAPLAVGFAHDVIGSYPPILLALAALGTLAALALLAVGGERKLG